MPLIIASTGPVQRLEGIAFKMTDGDRDIAVVVSTEALQDVESPPDESLARFHNYRERWADIARMKYASGEVVNDTIWIRSADVVGR